MRILNNKLHEDKRLKKELQCPYCNCSFNEICSEFGCGEIQDNDFSICVECKEIIIIQVYNNQISLRKHTINDLDVAKQQGILDALLEYKQFLLKGGHGLKARK